MCKVEQIWISEMEYRSGQLSEDLQITLLKKFFELFLHNCFRAGSGRISK